MYCLLDCLEGIGRNRNCTRGDRLSLYDNGGILAKGKSPNTCVVNEIGATIWCCEDLHVEREMPFSRESLFWYAVRGYCQCKSGKGFCKRCLAILLFGLRSMCKSRQWIPRLQYKRRLQMRWVFRSEKVFIYFLHYRIPDCNGFAVATTLNLNKKKAQDAYECDVEKRFRDMAKDYCIVRRLDSRRPTGNHTNYCDYLNTQNLVAKTLHLILNQIHLSSWQSKIITYWHRISRFQGTERPATSNVALRLL